MFNSQSKVPGIITGIYLFIALIAFGIMFATLKTDNMAAIFAIFISLPWSSLFFSFVDVSKSQSVFLNTILLSIGVALNTFIIYAFFSFVTRRK